ncbi:hypothetical protein C1886_13195 [Pseudomonas sp. FW300-N1A1]|uniref:hypothetical protein n=1 Tax=Pseudomonas sp. FW300-N1A1 TaxID=2075555 RepID=UPI000CD2F7DF|nr:hypothetical protein [Pseudomonas sp. FW300-N1A1]POA19347.1 hypothetical protein C1886_13195 [Pseudomonas sp. FW300-N1A1]
MKRHVQIISLQVATPDTASSRGANESILDVAKRETDRRQEQLIDVLRRSLTTLRKQPIVPQVRFFTAPELYWNIPWSCVKNAEELRALEVFYRQSIQQQVERIIRAFPAKRWGRLVLLPGTIALLTPSKKNSRRFEALNYVVAGNNFGPDFLRQGPFISLWPKRNTALIDFLGLSVQQAVEKDNKLIIFDPETAAPELFEGDPPLVFVYQLSNTLQVEVYELSTATAKHWQGGRLQPLFDNRVAPGLSFGIDICADIGLGRLEELYESEVKLDFLIAAGQPIPPGLELPTSVQYLIRNDGRAGRSAEGVERNQCELWTVVEGKTREVLPGRQLSEGAWLHQLEIN